MTQIVLANLTDATVVYGNTQAPTTTGSGNAQIATYTSPISAIAVGNLFMWKAGFSNTAAMTLGINGSGTTLGPYPVKLYGANPASGAVQSGFVYMTEFDGTNLNIVGSSAAPVISGDGTIAPTGALTVSKIGGTTLTMTSATSIGAGQYQGTATNDSATAGNIGETARQTATGVSLSNGIPANLTSVTLGAGDYIIRGAAIFNPAGTTTVTSVLAALSTTSVTFPAEPDESFAGINATLTTGAKQRLLVGAKEFKFSGSTQVWVVGQSSFGTSTMTADAAIAWQRIR